MQSAEAMKLLLSEDVAYIAGLFDGEGSVTLDNGTGGGKLLVQLSSTNSIVIDLLDGNFGGNINFTKTKSGKDFYHWSITSELATDFLLTILPYLRIKEEQAFIGMDWQATVQHNGKANRYTAEEVEFRAFLRQRLRELNSNKGRKLIRHEP